MRILFVVHDGISHEPLGLEYLSACLLEAGHKTKACMTSWIAPTINTFKPDFVAFQVLSGDERRWGAVARTIKERWPGIKIIFGGPHYLFFSKANQEEADFIIRGDGERSIVDVVEGRSHRDLFPIENLDDLPHPDRGLFYNENTPLIKSNVIRNEISCRGCPYKCTYCFNSMPSWQKMVGEGKNRLRYHSPEWICDDIEKTFKDYGGELVSFQDDIFGIDLKWLDDFRRLYRRINIPFFAQLRPHLITEERVKMLKDAGVHIVSFAIESGNERTRREILDRNEPNDLIENGCKLLHRYGIKFRMQNMLGLPVDDPLSDALETLRFNMKCRPTLSWCSLLQAYPGTVIADYVVKKGIVKSMEELTYKVDSTFFDEVSLPIKDKEKIERLHKYWSAVVRWPWLYKLIEVAINLNMGKQFETWLFEKTKQYINAKEYWRVDRKFERHLSVQRTMDRLGNELVRDPQKEEACV